MAYMVSLKIRYIYLSSIATGEFCYLIVRILYINLLSGNIPWCTLCYDFTQDPQHQIILLVTERVMPLIGLMELGAIV